MWDAITKPEFTAQYFYGVRIEVTPRAAAVRSADGADTWGENAGARVGSAAAPLARVAEPLRPRPCSRREPSRVTWEIEAQDGGFSKLTVIHDRLENAPKTAASVSGAGWMMVLSGLKSVLETGTGSVNTVLS